MRLLWASAAERDRLLIFEHIARDNPAAAVRVDDAIAAAAATLREHPRAGKAGLIPGTRELIPVEHYRLVYEVTADAVLILAVVHTARMWPPSGHNPHF